MNCNETSIYNLYGALFESTQEGFPLRSLYAMLGTLGMSEDAVRLALSRMARKGLLYTKRKARSSYYFLSEAGASIMRRGADRSVFRGAPAKWDGKLRLLSYEFPESLRDQRNGLAAALRSAGFGRAASGLWVHAYGYPDAVMDLVRNADVSAAIDTYEATLTGDGPAFARRVWRLEIGRASCREKV